MPELKDLEIEIELRKHCIENSANAAQFHKNQYAEALKLYQNNCKRLRALEFQRYLHTPCYRYKVNGE